MSRIENKSRQPEIFGPSCKVGSDNRAGWLTKDRSNPTIGRQQSVSMKVTEKSANNKIVLSSQYQLVIQRLSKRRPDVVMENLPLCHQLK